MLLWLNNTYGMRVGISAYGAAWLSCQIPIRDGSSREVVLGTDNPEHMSQGNAYIGSSVGRYCGRIAGASFEIDGKRYQVDANEPPNHLHGGWCGLSRKKWQIIAHDHHHLILEVQSAHGEAGFPGNAIVRALFELGKDNILTITYHAETDRPSIFNLCNHAYFNLNGIGKSALNQYLTIHADQYQPVNEHNLPCANGVAVKGTEFDFQRARPIEDGIYDHSFWLERQEDAATLSSAANDLHLNISTTQPALHLYTGQGLGGEPGRQGIPYFACAGIALETQAPPDSANRFLNLVKATSNQPYHHQTSYHFSVPA